MKRENNINITRRKNGFKKMTEIEIKHHDKNYGILELLQEEIEKIKKNLLKSYDERAKFLAIMYPIVEVVLMICGDWTDEMEKTGRGKKPISHVSLMLINILAKLLRVSYRQVEREVNAHPSWLKALQLNKAPSHNKLSEFRTEMGASFFKNFFNTIRDLLYDLNLIKSDGGIADSAPIIASMNFARANTTPKIDEAQIKKFFESVDISSVITKLTITGKSRYTAESIIAFFLFEKTCGFLSRTQALRFLKEHPHIAELLGFISGNVPTHATFTYFTKKHGSVSTLLKPMVDIIATFLERSDSLPANSNMDTFFWSI